DSHMRSIACCLAWHRPGSHQCIGKFCRRLCQPKQRNACERVNACLGCNLIASGAFEDHQFGTDQIKAAALAVPPFNCRALLRSPNEIATWPRGEVADDRGFDVDGFGHVDRQGISNCGALSQYPVSHVPLVLKAGRPPILLSRNRWLSVVILATGAVERIARGAQPCRKI